MSDQSKLGLGQIITSDQKRDAIHVAVAPVTAARRLAPGDWVGLDEHGKADSTVQPIIGIVDPFLTVRVMPDDKFWLYLIPGSITSLRHDWTHPAFEPSKISHTAHVAKSQAWIAEEAARLDITVNALMGYAEQWLNFGDHTVQHGSEHWRDSFRATEFWHHYEILTGKPVEEEKRHSFFCCSC